MQIRFARSATKHRVSRRASLSVILRSERWIDAKPPVESGRTTPRRAFLGADEKGVVIEVHAAVMDNGDLLVIHAMPARAKTMRLFEEGD